MASLQLACATGSTTGPIHVFSVFFIDWGDVQRTEEMVDMGSTNASVFHTYNRKSRKLLSASFICHFNFEKKDNTDVR